MTLRQHILFAVMLCIISPATLRADPPDLDPLHPVNENDFEFGLRLLSGVRDNVLSFDDPAFYWFCRYVQGPDGRLALEPTAIDAAVPWKYLLERPDDYRGKPVVIEGMLVARWNWSVDNRGIDAPLHQCELSGVGTHALAAVITTESADHIPLRTSVRSKGYFIKVRAYKTTGGDMGAGPLFVARRLEPVAASTSTNPVGAGDTVRNGLFVLTAAAAAIWLLLRRWLRQRRPVPGGLGLGAKTDARGDTADDFSWLLAGEAKNEHSDAPPDGER